MNPSDLVRFERFISEMTTMGCWLWTGSLSQQTPTGAGSAGYGRFWLNGKQVRAHRAAYEHFVGPIPPGFMLDHLCRNRACCNPAHLEPVTHLENQMRGKTFAANNAAKTHCEHGHEFTVDNTARYVGIRRSCRTCRREATAKYRAGQRSAITSPPPVRGAAA